MRPVDVHVPAEPEMSRVVRLAASGLASLRGFDVAEIDDIKLAASEVLIALIEHGAGTYVHIRFVDGPDEFTIQGSSPVGPSFDIEHPDLHLCRVVLADICAEHRLDLVDGEMHITATLRRPFAPV